MVAIHTLINIREDAPMYNEVIFFKNDTAIFIIHIKMQYKNELISLIFQTIFYCIFVMLIGVSQLSR